MTDGAANNSGRDQRGRFGPGNPGGQGGPRRRSSELRRAVEEAVTPEQVAALARRVLRMGLEGNLMAARLTFDQTCGRPAEAAVEAEAADLALPRLRTAADCNLAIDRILDGLLKGTLSRELAESLTAVVLARLRGIEVNEVEQRLADLERTAATAQRSAAHPLPVLDPRFE